MKHSLKHYLFKLKWFVAIIVFVVFTGFVGENCWVRRFEQKREITKLKGEIDDYNRKYKADKKVMDEMKTDPDVVAKVAREKYLMKKENEDVYVFDEDSSE